MEFTLENNNKSDRRVNITKKIITIGEMIEESFQNKIKINDEFENREAWDEDKKSRFIEAILMGVQIKEFYLSEEEDESLALIESQERLLVLQKFWINKLKLQNLPNLRQLEGKTFEQLPEDLRFRMRNSKAILVIIKNDSEKEVKDFLCKRINEYGNI